MANNIYSISEVFVSFLGSDGSAAAFCTNDGHFLHIQQNGKLNNLNMSVLS